MKAYQFKGLMGLATIAVGIFALIYNDKIVGAGLVTSGVALMTDAGVDASKVPVGQ